MGNGTLKITLEGPYGSGKTTLANIIANELREIGAKVVFTDPAESVLPPDQFFDHVGFHGDFYDEVVIATKVTEPGQAG